MNMLCLRDSISIGEEVEAEDVVARGRGRGREFGQASALPLGVFLCVRVAGAGASGFEILRRFLELDVSALSAFLLPVPGVLAPPLPPATVAVAVLSSPPLSTCWTCFLTSDWSSWLTRVPTYSLPDKLQLLVVVVTEVVAVETVVEGTFVGGARLVFSRCAICGSLVRRLTPLVAMFPPPLPPFCHTFLPLSTPPGQLAVVEETLGLGNLPADSLPWLPVVPVFIFCASESVCAAVWVGEGAVFGTAMRGVTGDRDTLTAWRILTFDGVRVGWVVLGLDWAGLAVV